MSERSRAVNFKVLVQENGAFQGTLVKEPVRPGVTPLGEFKKQLRRWGLKQGDQISFSGPPDLTFQTSRRDEGDSRGSTTTEALLLIVGIRTLAVEDTSVEDDLGRAEVVLKRPLEELLRRPMTEAYRDRFNRELAILQGDEQFNKDSK